ncbi:MAG TPA: CPBP family glutamic-type intramembrane protease [Planctomycetota bacterium]|nr:CPBP family glutamic-type intramembrane protease [Planctomycetota bacterium]
MENQSRPPEDPVPARAHFHLALALIFVPFGVIAGWTLAILNVVRGHRTRAQQAWTRLLVALVAVDAVVFAGLLWMSGHVEEIQQKAEAASQPRVVIGVRFDPDFLRVEEVQPDLPGARAGLRPGDVVVRIDGKDVATRKALVDELQAGKPGETRTLGVVRDDATEEIPIVPEAPKRGPEKGLFEVEKTGDFRLADEVLLNLLPALALIGVLAAWAKLRPLPPASVWPGFLIVLVGSMGASLGTLALARSRAGGLSLGHFLMSLLLQTGAMLGLAWVVNQRGRPPAPERSPLLSPLRAGLQGLFYILTAMMRLLILFAAAALMFPDAPIGDPVVIRLAETHFGVTGGTMLFVALVIVGPLAEEALFRGYLLPRLASQWGPLAGLFWSSLLFALLHLRDGPMMVVIFVYGWVFGWARLRSGSIVASTVLHMAVNAVPAAAILLKG